MSRFLGSLPLAVACWILGGSSAEAANRTRIVIREAPTRTVHRVVEVPVTRTVERVVEVPVTRYVEVPATRSVIAVEPHPAVIVAPRRTAFYPR